MSEPFDAYHQWLGIPPAEQPPHHYRLLGLAPFEPDPNVIAHAADRQMAHLRSFATSKRSALSQRLLNEVAAAKVTLLKAEKKATYDAALQARLRASGASPAHVGIGSVAAGRAVGAAGAPPPLPTMSARDGAMQLGNAPARSLPRDTTAPVALINAAPRSVAAELAQRNRAYKLRIAAVIVFVLAAVAGVMAWQRSQDAKQTEIAGPAKTVVKPNREAPQQQADQTDKIAQPETNEDSQPKSEAASTEPQNPPKQQKGKSRKSPRSKAASGNKNADNPATSAKSDEASSSNSGQQQPLPNNLPRGLAPLRWSGNGHYYLLMPARKTWQEANAAAERLVYRGMTGYLVTLTEAAERDWVAATFAPLFANASRTISIGLSDADQEGKFRWMTDEPIVFTSWTVGEPNGGVKENFVEMDARGYWNDIDGTGRHFYLVEFGDGKSSDGDEPPSAVDKARIVAKKGVTAARSKNAAAGRTATTITDSTASKTDNQAAVVAKERIPSAEAQQATERQIRELFATDFANAKKGTAKKAAGASPLAATLMRHAEDTRDDPVAAYVLLDMARTAAIDAGDSQAALRALERLTLQFDIDVPAEKLATLTRLSTTASQPAALRAAYESAWQAAVRYAHDDEYADAAKTLKVAADIARKAKENEFARQTALRIRDMAALERDFQAVKASLEKLATDPDDPDANLAAGRWYWFGKGLFEVGVKHLAKGSDAELKATADKDIAVPSGAKEQLELANLWMAAAEKRKLEEKTMLEARAFYWYLKASAGAAGLDKASIDNRIEKLRDGIEKRLLVDAAKPAFVEGSNAAGFLMPGVVIDYFADPQLQKKLATKTALTIRSDFAHEREMGLAPGTRFTARWTGWIVPGKSGPYKIHINTRGAFWLDGKPLIGPRTNPPEAVVEVSARPHHFRYEMPDITFGSAPVLQFYPAGESPQPLPPDALFHVPLPGEPPVELRRAQINPAVKSNVE